MNVAEITPSVQVVIPSVVSRGEAFSYGRRRFHNAVALALGDAVALTLVVLAAGLLRLGLVGESLIPVWSWYLFPFWWCGAALAGLLPSWGLGPVEELRRQVTLLFTGFAGIAVFLFLGKQSADVSRLTISFAFVLSLFVVPLVRLQVKRFLIARTQWGVPAVIYGAGQTGSQVVRFLEHEKGLGYYPIGLFDDDPELWGEAIGSVYVLGSTDVVTSSASVAILARPDIDYLRAEDLLADFLTHYRTVLVIPNMVDAPSLWVRPRDLNGLLGLEIPCNLTSPLAQFGKRALDVTLVVVAMPFWVPLCGLLALLIWLEDHHNPLFFQDRIGKDSRIFETWKFRTMAPNANELLAKHLASNPALREEWEANCKLKEDPRITRVGKVLRRFSLDELPQLVNVLHGEMSLVGPRPLPRYHHTRLAARVQSLRALVRPGLTGLWQVSGRSEAGNEGMKELDPYYVRNWSLWLDLVVLVRTARAVLKGQGAY